MLSKNNETYSNRRTYKRSLCSISLIIHIHVYSDFDVLIVKWISLVGLKCYFESKDSEDFMLQGSNHERYKTLRLFSIVRSGKPCEFRRPSFLGAFARWQIAGYTVSPLSGVYEDDDEGCSTKHTRGRRGSHRRRWRSHRSLRIITSYPAFTF